MRANEGLNEINLYLNEVSRLLPYPQSKKKAVLEELRIDVQAAMKDSGGESISTVFGTPRDVAKNVSQGQGWHSEDARWRTRLYAWIVDLITQFSFAMMIIGGGFILLLFTGKSYEELTQEFTEWESEKLDWSTLSPQELLILVFIVSLISIAAIVFFGYNIVLEQYFGTTIGKKIFRLSVVDQTGIRITWKQALIRNLSKILLTYEFLLPLDVILGMISEKQDPDNTRKQRGLDILAKTIVIRQT